MASLLRKAAKEGDVDTVEMLVKQNPDIIDKHHDGWSALHSAVVANREEVVKTLLKLGADPDEENRYGAVPLFQAILQNRYELVRLLVVEGGANVMKFDGNMNTMAQNAKQRKECDPRIVELLEKREAERKKEIEEEKAEKARKRKEAAAKRAAEKEAGGGPAKKGKKGKQPAKKKAANDEERQPDMASTEIAEPSLENAEGGGGAEGRAGAEAEANVACSKVDDLDGGEALMFTEHSKWSEGRGFEVWTCGLVDKSHPPDHSLHRSASWSELDAQRARLDELLAGFKPAHIQAKWQSFAITPETLETNGVGGEGVDVARALCKVLAGDGLAGNCRMQSRVVREGGIPAPHMFHPRFWKTAGGGRDQAKADKAKFAANKIRALCKHNSVKHVQFANDGMAVVDARQFLVGRLREGGGLMVISFHDDSEDHYHHGSFEA